MEFTSIIKHGMNLLDLRADFMARCVRILLCRGCVCFLYSLARVYLTASMSLL
jgi:hypothetical protein